MLQQIPGKTKLFSPTLCLLLDWIRHVSEFVHSKHRLMRSCVFILTPFYMSISYIFSIHIHYLLVKSLSVWLLFLRYFIAVLSLISYYKISRFKKMLVVWSTLSLVLLLNNNDTLCENVLNWLISFYKKKPMIEWFMCRLSAWFFCKNFLSCWKVIKF